MDDVGILRGSRSKPAGRLLGVSVIISVGGIISSGRSGISGRRGRIRRCWGSVGRFRSTIADSRGAVAGARDVGAKEGVAEKENHTECEESKDDGVGDEVDGVAGAGEVELPAANALVH